MTSDVLIVHEPTAGWLRIRYESTQWPWTHMYYYGKFHGLMASGMLIVRELTAGWLRIRHKSMSEFPMSPRSMRELMWNIVKSRMGSWLAMC
jgi:hypothetical protein